MSSHHHQHRAASPKPASKAPAAALFNQVTGSDDEDDLLSNHGNQQTQAPGDDNLESSSSSGSSSSSSEEDDITSTQDYGLTSNGDEDMGVGGNNTAATTQSGKGKGYIPSLNVTPVPRTSSSITRISKPSSLTKRIKGARFDAKRRSQFSPRIFGLLKAKLQIEKGVNFKKAEAVPKIFAAELTVIYKALMETILQSKQKHVLSALLNSENALCKVAGSKRKRVYWNKQALLKTLNRTYKGRNITVSDVRDAMKHGSITAPYFAKIEMPVGKSSVQTVVKTKKELLAADKEDRASKKLEYKKKLLLVEEIALQKQKKAPKEGKGKGKGKKGGADNASGQSKKRKEASTQPSSGKKKKNTL